MSTLPLSAIMLKIKKIDVCSLLMLTLFSGPAIAETQWSMHALGYLAGDQQYAINQEHLVFDMNNLGQVVGWSVATPYGSFDPHPLQAYVTAPNGGEILANLGRIEPYMESNSLPYAINDLGQVVYYVARLGSIPGHVIAAPPYESTEGVDVGFGRESPTLDINNHGIAVGFDGYSTGFTYTITPDNDSSNYQYGTATPVALGMPSGINDSNQIACIIGMALTSAPPLSGQNQMGYARSLRMERRPSPPASTTKDKSSVP